MDTGCRVQGLTCILFHASSQLVKIEEKLVSFAYREEEESLDSLLSYLTKHNVYCLQIIILHLCP